jgi:hypothetical protein
MLLDFFFKRMEQGEWNKMERHHVLVSGGLCIFLVAGVMWMLVVRPAAKRETVDGIRLNLDRDFEETSESENQFSPLVSNATGKDFEAVVREFMNSSTNEERCRWVNGGAAMLEKMTEFYSREQEEAPNGFDRVIRSFSFPLAGIPMQEVHAVSREGGRRYFFSVFLGKERVLIDWESSVGYGEMAWEAFAAEHPTELVEMRIFLQPTNYYNYEFSDDRKYQCFSLAMRGGEASLYGYVERDSDTARGLLAAVSPRGALPVRVRVKFLPWSVDKKMVWIEELIHLYWVDSTMIEEALER